MSLSVRITCDERKSLAVNVFINKRCKTSQSIDSNEMDRKFLFVVVLPLTVWLWMFSVPWTKLLLLRFLSTCSCL